MNMVFSSFLPLPVAMGGRLDYLISDLDGLCGALRMSNWVFVTLSVVKVPLF